jgi:hypothetical protein
VYSDEHVLITVLNIRPLPIERLCLSPWTHPVIQFILIELDITLPKQLAFPTSCWCWAQISVANVAKPETGVWSEAAQCNTIN